MAVPSRKKPEDDFDDDEEGIFTGEDYKQYLGFDPFVQDEDEESEDEKR